jgi:hypothetical protein
MAIKRGLCRKWLWPNSVCYPSVACAAHKEDTKYRDEDGPTPTGNLGY